MVGIQIDFVEIDVRIVLFGSSRHRIRRVDVRVVILVVGDECRDILPIPEVATLRVRAENLLGTVVDGLIDGYLCLRQSRYGEASHTDVNGADAILSFSFVQ